MILIILQLDEYFGKGLKVDADSKAGASQQMVWVTDGQLPLRQCLHPESCTKGFDLPGYYNAFFDLRKEFRKAYPSTASPAASAMRVVMSVLARATSVTAVQISQRSQVASTIA